MSFQPRFENNTYRDCRFCAGRGCLACPAEAEKAYRRAFPDGPKPILTIEKSEIDALEISEMTGGPGMDAAHGPFGKLAAEILEAIQEERK